MSIVIPTRSAFLFNGIDLNKAFTIAQSSKALYDSFDLTEAGKKDPSKCGFLVKLSNGPIMWESKQAVDADGVNGNHLDPADGQSETSYRFRDGSSLDATKHPYVVLPGGLFRMQTGLALGDVGVAIYADKIVPFMCGDLGPVHKIGESSIKVHEGFMPAAPDPCRRDANGVALTIHDVSIESEVITVVWPNSRIVDLTRDTLAAEVAAKALDLFSKLKHS